MKIQNPARDTYTYCTPRILEKARCEDADALYSLYTDNRPLIWKIAKRYAHFDFAVSLDDLLQEAFFAVMEAAKTFDSNRGSWQQALVWALKRRFRQMLHLNRKRNRIVSLDTPVGEDENTCLGECLADTGAVIDSELLRDDFKKSVHKAIQAHTDAQTASVIMMHDIAGQTLKDVAQAFGCSYQIICTKRRMAFCRLRTYRDLRELYRDALEIDTLTFRHSAEECAVLLLSEWKI